MREEIWNWQAHTGEQRLRAGPFIKWAGGKGQLLDHLKFPSRFNNYHEPFLGGGAVFFALQPRSSFLSDVNPELINAYHVVKQNVEALIDSLRELEREYSEEKYYEMRALDPEWLDPVARAACFVFLNKTCYNGLYRVNRAGKFNVPFGHRKRPRVCDPEGLRAASTALRHAVIKTRDFRDALRIAERGDFAYLDPPYVPISKTSAFTEYTSSSFSWADHEALADEAERLRDEVGCQVLLSNSYSAKVKSLYQRKGFQIRHVTAARAISSKASTRGKINELVISSY